MVISVKNIQFFMVTKIRMFFAFLCFVSLPNHAVLAEQSLSESTWVKQDSQVGHIIQVYFFWSKKCPHCLEALPFIKELSESNDDINLHSLQLVGEKNNIRRYEYMAMKLGKSSQSVPAFMFCNSMHTGFDAENSPAQLVNDIELCRRHIKESGSLESFQLETPDHLQINLPFIGVVDTENINSLPVITLVIASIDAFNPCAFFVLMFLLSIMLHTRKRSRMFLVGAVFVFVSGLMYFLFMTAWLNLFRVIGQIDAITLGAGFVAIFIGLINIKDYFWFKKGVALVISDSAKQTLFHRMRLLLSNDSLSGVLLATISLAVFANLYEFLCTAGFPMVYTRILTLANMPEWKHYAYLLFYNLIYILPLLTIVILFSWTMGARKLQESEGRNLKFISGVMMLSLGVILLFAPQLLQNILATGLVLVLVVLISVLVIIIDRRSK